MADQPQWQSLTFKGEIFGIFKLPGASQWRYIKENGVRRVFPTEKAALEAARDTALRILFPAIHSTTEPSEKKVAEALGVEEWLRSKRQDIKNAKTVYRPGNRPFTAVTGKARA